MPYLSNQRLNYVSQFFDNLGNMKCWNNLKIEFQIGKNFHFAIMQLVDPLPKGFKKLIKANGAAKNLL